MSLPSSLTSAPGPGKHLLPQVLRPGTLRRLSRCHRVGCARPARGQGPAAALLWNSGRWHAATLQAAGWVPPAPLLPACCLLAHSTGACCHCGCEFFCCLASTERCFLSSLACIDSPGAAIACAGVDPLPEELEGQLESEVLRAPFFIEAAVILPAHKALLLADTGGAQSLGSWVTCADCCRTVAGLPPYGSTLQAP